MKELVTYLCPRCDNAYYTIDRETWDTNRAKYDRIAQGLKVKHRCPWDKRKKGGSK